MMCIYIYIHMMCIYIYIHMMCIYICTYEVCTHIYIYIHILCICVYIYIHIAPRLHRLWLGASPTSPAWIDDFCPGGNTIALAVRMATCLGIPMQVYDDIHVYIYTHLCVYIYIYIYTMKVTYKKLSE